MKEHLPLQQNVDKILLDGKEIILVGTAHISAESVELARKVIQEEQPDAVAVELCDKRLKALEDPEKWRNTDIIKVLKEGKAYVLLAQLALGAFQRKLSKEMNIRPGAEMLAAVNQGRQQGANILLIDREIHITLKRIWGKLGFKGMAKLLYAGIQALFSKEKVTSDEIERLKKEDALHAALEEFSKEFPEIKETLISERDKYMAYQLQEAPAKKVVGIIGAGHIPGIIAALGTPLETKTITELPPKSRVGTIFKWLIPLIILLLIIKSFLYGGKEEGLHALYSWVGFTSGAALLGALLANAHPLTALLSMAVAPFTAVNPFMRTGWISALSEGMLRKPRVVDMEQVFDDFTSFTRWRRNGVIRILFILVAVNLLTLVGAVAAGVGF